jgi:hypothetical protein
MGIHSLVYRLTFDLLGVLFKGEKAAVGLPILPSLIGVSLKMSNLFVVSKLVVSNKVDEKKSSQKDTTATVKIGRMTLMEEYSCWYQTSTSLQNHQNFE